jgi:hypothetical protein
VDTSEYDLLKYWLGRDFRLELIFASYNDGDLAWKFHSKCDGVSPTVTFIKTSTGKRFGGYSIIPWATTYPGEYVNSRGNEFVFSLDHKRKLVNKKTKAPYIMDQMISLCLGMVMIFLFLTVSYQIIIISQKYGHMRMVI